MLQILIWASAVLIVGVGYIGQQVAIPNRKDKEKDKDGNGFFGFMFILALALFILSLVQGGKMSITGGLLP
jgi:putative Mn2+ efflux pump MntP